jgi:CRP-like cAMP-binding protein
MMEKFSLKEVQIFSQLSEAALVEIAKELKTRQLAKGELVFKQGDPGDELIIVEKGRISIFAPLEDEPGDGQPIRFFQAGEVLGEMALIDRKPRSLSARAEEPSSILILHGSDFRRIMSQSPGMTLSVMTGLSDRIRYTTDFLREVRMWVQRIAEGDYLIGEFEEGKYRDRTLATLAAEFTQMAARVQEREEILRKEVLQLRIEIDQVKREQDAQRIMESDYYKSLKEKAKSLRKRDK